MTPLVVFLGAAAFFAYNAYGAWVCNDEGDDFCFAFCAAMAVGWFVVMVGAVAWQAQ